MKNDTENDLSFQNYREHVRTLAAELVAQEKERPEEDRYDLVHELVDASAWVIYNYRALAVLQHSQNADAMFEEGCPPGNLSRFGASIWDIITPAAFWALRADVLEEAPEREEAED